MQQKKIGRYEIKELLGAGGMGSVYRAFDPDSNRDVALKVINLNALRRTSHEKRDETLKRFRNEVRVIAQLQQVAIVPLFDSGDDNGTPYMVMPLMKGGSLEARLLDKDDNPQPLLLAEIERILAWITPALDKMHAQNIVHRDLKPANILFDEDNYAYIADFGIAKLTEGSITFNTGTIGTPGYMSPEQAEDQKKVDPRSDVYSLGAMLYKMLTGERPYHKAHPAILPYYHINEPPPRLDELRSDLHPSWQAIIDKAMAKKPDERYQTVSELSAAVTQLLRDEAEQKAHERKAREQALREKEGPDATFEQTQTVIPILSSINPLDQLRFLWWIFVEPQQLKSYKEQYGQAAAIQTSKWLISTLTWLPLLFTALAFGLETLPHNSEAFSSMTYLWISLGSSILWLLTGLFGEKENHDGTFSLVLIVVGVVVGLVATNLFKVIPSGGSPPFKLAFLVVQFMAVFIALLWENPMARTVALAVMLGWMGGYLGFIAGLIALVFIRCFAKVMTKAGYRIEGKVMDKFVLFVAIILGLILRLLLGVSVFDYIILIAVVFLPFFSVNKGLESGQSSLLGGTAFGLLVIAYAFLLWFCFFGGWRAFA